MNRPKTVNTNTAETQNKIKRFKINVDGFFVMRLAHLKHFGNEETLLDVILLGSFEVNIFDATVSTVRSTMLFNGLHSIPAPIAILLIMCQTPQNKVTLKCFRPQNVILFLRSQRFRFGAFAKSVEN